MVAEIHSVPWSANMATDYRFRRPQFIGNRGGDTIRDPNNLNLAIDDPRYDAISWVEAKGYYSATGTMSYTLRLKESRRWLPKTSSSISASTICWIALSPSSARHKVVTIQMTPSLFRMTDHLPSRRDIRWKESSRYSTRGILRSPQKWISKHLGPGYSFGRRFGLPTAFQFLSGERWTYSMLWLRYVAFDSEAYRGRGRENECRHITDQLAVANRAEHSVN
jgi:hypothetical protein